MNSEMYLFIVFFIFFTIGVLLVGYIETYIKRKKAQERYVRHLENENSRLNRTVAILKLTLDTKGGNNKRA